MVLFDEGYSKSIYVSTILPHDQSTGLPFYSMSNNGKATWVLMLVKALAKYFGSYDELR